MVAHKLISPLAFLMQFFIVRMSRAHVLNIPVAASLYTCMYYIIIVSKYTLVAYTYTVNQLLSAIIDEPHAS